MVYLGANVFKYLNTGKITPEAFFTGTYVKEVYESEHVHTTTTLLHVILYAKYEEVGIHKFMETQCQHLTMTQRSEFLKLLHKFEELLNGTLGTCKNIQYTSSKKRMQSQCACYHTQ